MKRYISSSSRFSTRYTVKDWHGFKNENYIAYISNEDNPENLVMQISGLHPYDDAEYVTARFERGAIVRFMQSGKIVQEKKFPKYEDSEWEDPWEYIDEMVDRTISVLHKLNEDVEPKIMHF